MIEWILIIKVLAESANATDSYSSIRFKSKISCQKEAERINRSGLCMNTDCTSSQIHERAWCVADESRSGEASK